MTLIPIDWHHSGRKLAVFAGAWLALLGTLGLVLWLKGQPSAAAACLPAAAVMPLLRLFSLKALRAVFVLASLLTLLIGWVVSLAVLAVVYFLVVTPIGLLLRTAGYDPLGRRLDPQANSYWMPYKTDDDLEGYFRQY